MKTSNAILNQPFPGQINTLYPGAGLDILSLFQDYPHSCNLWSAQGTDRVNLCLSVKHPVDTKWVNMILIKQAARQRWKGITCPIPGTPDLHSDNACRAMRWKKTLRMIVLWRFRVPEKVIWSCFEHLQKSTNCSVSGTEKKKYWKMRLLKKLKWKAVI